MIWTFLVSWFMLNKLKSRNLRKGLTRQRAKTGDGDFSHSRSGIHGRSKFQQSFFGQGSSNNPPLFNIVGVSNPITQGGNGVDLHYLLLVCGRKHEGKCLSNTDGWFSCGKSGHKIRDCPILMAKGREGKQAPPCGSGSSAPKKNRLCALETRHEQEGSPKVVTGMLKLFQIDFYALLHPDAALSFLTTYVSKRYDIFLGVLLDPFSDCTQVGDSIVAKRVYKKCPISLSYRVTHVDLVELDILEFDVILGMDWIHACNASIDCRTRVVKF
ncbi:hypothetical protein MTR67_030952 [Solanum verrucosum]|uniref:CCHC-type domain-containing protein n=1 Tax=Solanum verrucosum TaxID=315347 RepID=A0AAF0U1I9_SOLVR|nr:hypothetical protein MTR67_030947 [Solanum verrucosum]WMV37565.1 hypothetical protein MTR67_030950 [Solanum verrucosum]WMV37567.1 hypothetical protein MTR67_030952 [Solanum verrucosum]